MPCAMKKLGKLKNEQCGWIVESNGERNRKTGKILPGHDEEFRS